MKDLWLIYKVTLKQHQDEYDYDKEMTFTFDTKVSAETFIEAAMQDDSINVNVDITRGDPIVF